MFIISNNRTKNKLLPKGLLLLLISFLPHYVFAQAITRQIIDHETNQPIPDAVVRDSSGKIITFSNEEGYFKVNNAQHVRLSHKILFTISCLGYKTKQLTYDSVYNSSVIMLKRITYSLPAVFVGNYATHLIKAAYKKADSLNGIYFYGKGVELQFCWINHKPTEYYEYLQKDKISVSGIIEKEITNARHGIISSSLYSSPLAKFKLFVDKMNWYHQSVHLKKLFKKYDFRVQRIFYWNSETVVKVLFTMKRNYKHYQEKGYYYIDAHTHDVLKYEKTLTIPELSMPFLFKTTNFKMHSIEYYSVGKPFALLSNSSLSASAIFVKNSGSISDTLNYYNKSYIISSIPWKDSISFKPTKYELNNRQLYQNYKNKEWTKPFPLILSSTEKSFIQYVNEHNF